MRCSPALQQQQCEQLNSALQKAHNALQVCDRRLAQLGAQLEATVGQLIDWQQVRDQ